MTRRAESAAPWDAYLPAGASPGAIKLAHALWTNGLRPIDGAWQTPGGVDGSAPGPNPGPHPATSTSTPTPAPAAAAPPDYNALTLTDPQYVQGLAGLTRARHDDLVNFGGTAGIPGVDNQTALDAAANPNSVVHQLDQQHQGLAAGIRNQNNQHGLLFSGVHAQQQQNEGAAAQQRYQAAYQSLLGSLNGLSDQQNNLYWSVFNRLSSGAMPTGGS